MKKSYILLFMVLFTILLIGGVVGASPGIYVQGEDINLLQTCANCNSVNITSVTSPNGTQLIGSVPMTKDGSVYNFTLLGGNVTTFGTYRVNGIGDPDGTNEIWVYSFEVTYSGFELKEGQSFLYVSLFVILIFFFILILFAINQLPRSNQKDEEGRILSITYLKYLRPVGWMFEYFLVIAMLYLSSNLAFAYLNEQLFAKILFMLFRILFMFAPVVVIVWMIWIFVQMFHDKQMQKLLNRGFFPQGKL